MLTVIAFLVALGLLIATTCLVWVAVLWHWQVTHRDMSSRDILVYLGALPLNLQIRLQADAGKPTVVSDPDGEVAGIYKAVARQVAVKVAAKAKDFSSKFPSIKISKDT